LSYGSNVTLPPKSNSFLTIIIILIIIIIEPIITATKIRKIGISKTFELNKR